MKILGYIIVVKRSGTDGTPYPLTSTNPSCSIGRGIECDIRVQLPVVSSQHCRIEVEVSGKAYLTNVSLSNPAYLNEVELCPEEIRLLSHGDIIHIADRKLRWEYPEDSVLSLTRDENVTFKILTPKSKAPISCLQEISLNGNDSLSGGVNCDELMQDAAKRKRVSFGRQLDPEHFDKQLPPSTPIKKGEKPDGFAFASPYVPSTVKRTTRLSVLSSTPSIAEEVGTDTPTKSLLRRRSPTPIKPYLARSLGLLTPKSLRRNTDTTESVVLKSEINDAATLKANSPYSSPNKRAFDSSPPNFSQSLKSIHSPDSSFRFCETPKAASNISSTNREMEDVGDKTSSGLASLKTMSAIDSLTSVNENVIESPSSRFLCKTSSVTLKLKSPDDFNFPNDAVERPTPNPLLTPPNHSSCPVSPCEKSDTQQQAEIFDNSSLNVNESTLQTPDTFILEKLRSLDKKETKSRVPQELKARKSEKENSTKSRQSISVEVKDNDKNCKTFDFPMMDNLVSDKYEDTHDIANSSQKKRCNELEKPLELSRSSPRKLDLSKKISPLRKSLKSVDYKRRSLRTPKNPKKLLLPKNNTPVIVFDELKVFDSGTEKLEKRCSLKSELLENDKLPVLEIDSSAMKTTKSDITVPAISQTKPPGIANTDQATSKMCEIEMVDLSLSETSEVSISKSPKVNCKSRTPRRRGIEAQLVCGKDTFGSPKNNKKLSDDQMFKTLVPSIVESHFDTPQKQVYVSKPQKMSIDRIPGTDQPSTPKSESPDDSIKNQNTKYPLKRKSTSKPDPLSGSCRLSVRIMDIGKRKTPMRKTLKPVSVKKVNPKYKSTIKRASLPCNKEQIRKRKASLSPTSLQRKKMKVLNTTPSTGNIARVLKSSSTGTPPIPGKTPKKSWADILKRGLMAHGIPATKAQKASSVMNKARLLHHTRKKENCVPYFDTEIPETFKFSQSTGHVNSPAPIIIRNKIAKTPKLPKYRKGRKSNIMQVYKTKSINEIDLEGLVDLLNTPRSKDKDIIKEETGWTLDDIVNHYTPRSKAVRMKEMFLKDVRSTPLANIPNHGSDTPQTSFSFHSLSTVSPFDFSPVTPPTNVSRKTRSMSSVAHTPVSKANTSNFDFCAVKTPDISSDNLILPLVTPHGPVMNSEHSPVSQGLLIDSPIPVEADLTIFDFDNAITPLVTPDIFVSPMSTRAKRSTPSSHKSKQIEEVGKESSECPSEILENVEHDQTKEIMLSDVNLHTPKPNNSNIFSIKRLLRSSRESFTDDVDCCADINSVDQMHYSVNNYGDSDIKDHDNSVVEERPEKVGSKITSPSIVPRICTTEIKSKDIDLDIETISDVPVTEQETCSDVPERKRQLTPKPAVKSHETYKSMDRVTKLMKTPEAVSECELNCSDIEDKKMAPVLVKEIDDADVKGVKLYLKTPEQVVQSPGTNYSNRFDLKKVMKSSKPVIEREADYTDVLGIKKLLRTPGPGHEPDYTDVIGMKRLLRTPKEVVKSPGTDYCNVFGIKKLMTTPKPLNEHEPDYTDVVGVKKLLRSSGARQEPDYTDVRGIRKLLITPKQNVVSPGTDYSNVAGVSKLMKTPSIVVQHEPDYTDVVGVKNLLRTPTAEQEPDYTDVKGLKRLLRTPKQDVGSPAADYSNVAGVKKLMKTPKTLVPEQEANYTDFTGVRRMMRTPKAPAVEKDPAYGIFSGIKKVLRTPKSFKVNLEGDNADEDLKTPKGKCSENEPYYTDVIGLKRFLSTSDMTIESTAAVNTDVYGIQEMSRTPEPVENIILDEDNSGVHEVKNPMKSPNEFSVEEADYGKVGSLKMLPRIIEDTNLIVNNKTMSTTVQVPEYEANYSPSTKKSGILKTPEAGLISPVAGYSLLACGKNLLSSSVAQAPDNETDYTDLTDHIDLGKNAVTSEIYPVCDYTNVQGLRKLLRTPRKTKNVESDYSNLQGLKKLLTTPRQADAEPFSDYTNVAGLKSLFKTPTTNESPQGDYSCVYGLRNLMKTPKLTHKSFDLDLDGLSHLLKTPLSKTSNVEQILDMVKESLSSSSHSTKSSTNDSIAIESLPENIPPTEKLKKYSDLVKEDSGKEVISPRRSRRNIKNQGGMDVNSRNLNLVQGTSLVDSSQNEESNTASFENILKNLQEKELAVPAAGRAKKLCNKNEVKVDDDTPKKSNRRTRKAAKEVQVGFVENSSIDIPLTKANRRGRGKTALKVNNTEPELDLHRITEKKIMNENIMHSEKLVIKVSDDGSINELNRDLSIQHEGVTEIGNIDKLNLNEDVLMSLSVDSTEVKELSVRHRRGRGRQTSSTTLSSVSEIQNLGEKITTQKRRRGQKVTSITASKESTPLLLDNLQVPEKGRMPPKNCKEQHVEDVVLISEESMLVMHDINNMQDLEGLRRPQRRGRGRKVALEVVGTLHDSTTDQSIKRRKTHNDSELQSNSATSAKDAVKKCGRKKSIKKEMHVCETIVNELAKGDTEDSITLAENARCKQTRIGQQTEVVCGDCEEDLRMTSSDRIKRTRATVTKLIRIDKPENNKNEVVTEVGKEVEGTVKKTRATRNQQNPSHSLETSTAIEVLSSSKNKEILAKSSKRRVQFVEDLQTSQQLEEKIPALRRGRTRKIIEISKTNEDISETSNENREIEKVSRRTRAQLEKISSMDVVSNQKETHFQKARRGPKRKCEKQPEEVQPLSGRENKVETIKTHGKKRMESEEESTSKQNSRKKTSKESTSTPKRVTRSTRSRN